MILTNISRETLLNGWLKYHNKTVKDVITELTPDEIKDPKWFNRYAVTQEQADEWERWAIDLVYKDCKIPKYKNSLPPLIYLDCAPSIKMENNEDNTEEA